MKLGFWKGLGKPFSSSFVSQQQYWQRVKALGPIAYWPLWDAAGSLTAVDLMGLGNGTLGTGGNKPTLGATGISDGKTACSFDGTDFINVYSAAFIAAFSGVAGTVAAWVQNDDWTSAFFRRIFDFTVDADNGVAVQHLGGTNNSIYFRYEAGNTVETVTHITTAPAGFFHVAITWDKNAGASGEMKAYYNGVQVGATQTTLGTFAGNLAATTTVIGASNTSGQNGWSGDLAHVAVWTRALTVTEIARLANP